MLRLPEPWNTVRRQAKRACWAVALVIAPLAFYFALNRFLMDKFSVGEWWWSLLIIGGAITCGLAYDVATGHYDLSPHLRRQPTGLAQDFQDAPWHLD